MRFVAQPELCLVQPAATIAHCRPLLLQIDPRGSWLEIPHLRLQAQVPLRTFDAPNLSTAFHQVCNHWIDLRILRFSFHRLESACRLAL